VTANIQLMVEARAARPIVKWVGGKTKLLPELLARMPATFDRYYEPFAGGAALFFRRAPARAVIGDANADLISAYQALARSPCRVLAELDRHQQCHGEVHFYDVRSRWNDRVGDAIERAAAFVYLNRAGFNGLWRVNRYGRHNVAWGKYAAFEPDAENLRAAATMLASAELRAGDYRATLHDAQSGDFAFFDPPYDGTFGSYTADKSDEVDQAELAFEVRTLARRGVRVMVSSSDTQRIRDLYAGLRMDRVHAPRSINRDGAGRGKVTELIITAGYEPRGAA
jgi:DNA adenine methylase